MSFALVILAAGAGSRFGGPKQLAPIGPNGETLLEYSVFDALRAGFGRVILVVQRESEAHFRRRFAGRMDRQVEIGYAHQALSDVPNGFRAPPGRSKPWGTGHAVLAARELVDGPFAVINADDLYGAESYAILCEFLRERGASETELAVVGFPVARTLAAAGPVSRALCEVAEDQRLRRIVELHAVWNENGRVHCEDRGGRRALEGDKLVSMNMWGFVPSLLRELESRFADFLLHLPATEEREFLLPDVIQGVIESGAMEVEVLRATGDWCGVTFRDDLDAVADCVSRRVERGDYPEELWR